MYTCFYNRGFNLEAGLRTVDLRIKSTFHLLLIYQGQHQDMVILLKMITLHRHQLLDIQYLVTIHIPLVRPHFKSHCRGAWKILDWRIFINQPTEFGCLTIHHHEVEWDHTYNIEGWFTSKFVCDVCHIVQPGQSEQTCHSRNKHVSYIALKNLSFLRISFKNNIITRFLKII